MAFNKNTQAGMVINSKIDIWTFWIFITINQWNPDKTGGSDEKKGLIWKDDVENMEISK